MKKRKIILLPLLVSLLASCGGVNPSSEEIIDVTNKDGDGYQDAMVENNNNGQILHCFNWTYNQIKENLVNIKNAGYKMIQTSPVQTPKAGGAFWWSYYQPVSFSIAEKSVLGTKEELKAMCEEAEKLGIDVIADIVFNHLANVDEETLEPDRTPTVSEEVGVYEPEIYALRNDKENPTFHHNIDAEGSGAVTQKYDHGNLPDLNTAHPLVQKRSLDLLKECIDVGIDGFRFDAAKHIETPTDPEYASDFWPNTLEVAKTYYKEKTNKDLYAYGEVLAAVEGGRKIDCYTPFMKVTDTSYINNYATAVMNNDPNKLVNANFGKDTTSDNLITWVESHDIFTSSKSHDKFNRVSKLWAVISGRKGTQNLFFARPDSDATVGKIHDYAFENELIAAANRFHNRYVIEDENQYAEKGFYINERFGENTFGAVIVATGNNLEFQTENLTNLKTQAYFDQISGQEVDVINGKANFTLDESGIAFLTPSKNTARPNLIWDNRGGSFVDDKSVKVKISHASEAYYTINDGEHKPLEMGDNTIKLYKADAKEDKTLTLKIHLKNGPYTLEKEALYRTVDLIPGGFNVVNFNPSHFDNYDVYIWRWSPMDGGFYTQDFTYEGTTLLFDTTGLTGFLIVLMPKGHVIEDNTKWDEALVKQTQDIKGGILQQGFFDATGF